MDTMTHANENLYLNQLNAFITAYGHHVNVWAPQSLDDDLVYMAHAKTFVRGGGGYSNSVANIIERQHGRVLGCEWNATKVAC
jgi:hypothetical protein